MSNTSAPGALQKNFRHGVGYAYSTNPVDPRLFGWAGAGPETTIGYQFLEVSAGRFWANFADAASTDLIDRKLVQSEELSFFGFNLRQDFHVDQIESLPLLLKLRTRSTLFLSSRNDEAIWRHHWALDLDADFSPLLESPFSAKLLVLTGPEPVPGFKQNSRIWDYLFKVDPLSDAMSMIGVGTSLRFEQFKAFTLTFGFFGGYVGAQVGIEPIKDLIFNFESYGVETTAAYQAQEMRFWGADLQYHF